MSNVDIEQAVWSVECAVVRLKNVAAINPAAVSLCADDLARVAAELSEFAASLQHRTLEAAE